MKSHHLAFISYPLYPHTGPTLPVVSVLVRRGYRVSYATSDLFADRIARLGADIVPLLRVPTPAPGPGYVDTITTFAERALEDIRTYYQNNRPSLILYDVVALAGRILADRLGVPAVQTSALFSHDRQYHDRQVRDLTLRSALLRSSGAIELFLKRAGVANSDYLFHREKLNIYFCPRALQPCGDDIEDPSSFYAGRCAGEQPYFGHWQRPSIGDRPIILVATSTHYVRGADYFKMCIEALENLRCHVVLSLGDSGDPTALMPLPPNFEIVQHISHVAILPYTSLFVCLGGNITSAEAAYHGVPLVVTSHGFPELEWQADNLAALGVAIHLRQGDTSAANIRDAAIRTFGDAVMIDRVNRMRRRVTREFGAEETANRIEDFLDTYLT